MLLLVLQALGYREPVRDNSCTTRDKVDNTSTKFPRFKSQQAWEMFDYTCIPASPTLCCKLPHVTCINNRCCAITCRFIFNIKLQRFTCISHKHYLAYEVNINNVANYIWWIIKYYSVTPEWRKEYYT